ncbi:MAG: hypothetical protein JRJ84_18955 [Deltaproteobacteria bacterium]|nr:hypothetical protein [Deltaproteobacteria bacterium]
MAYTETARARRLVLAVLDSARIPVAFAAAMCNAVASVYAWPWIMEHWQAWNVPLAVVLPFSMGLSALLAVGCIDLLRRRLRQWRSFASDGGTAEPTTARQVRPWWRLAGLSAGLLVFVAFDSTLLMLTCVILGLVAHEITDPKPWRVALGRVIYPLSVLVIAVSLAPISSSPSAWRRSG